MWPDDGCPAVRILHIQQEREQTGTQERSCKIATVEGEEGDTECNDKINKHKRTEKANTMAGILLIKNTLKKFRYAIFN